MNLDLSVLWVIGFVLLLTAIVNRLLFQPVLQVVRDREGAITSAGALAEESANRAKAALAEYETRTTAARAEVYKEMDERRRQALAFRSDLLASARAEVETSLRRATDDLERARQEARGRLDAEARVLGDAIVGRVLERKAR
ncbi:MAG: ATP synthase F0 subunit B [Vicinamibacterales bacterium]